MAPSLTWALALILRSTVVLAVALALVAPLRRRRVVACHGLLTLTAASLLLLPALPGFLPRWELRLAGIPSADTPPPLVEPLRSRERDAERRRRPRRRFRGPCSSGAEAPRRREESRLVVDPSRDGGLVGVRGSGGVAGRRPRQPARPGARPHPRTPPLVRVAAPRRCLDGDAGRGPTLDRRVPPRAPPHVRGDRRPDDGRLEAAGRPRPARGGAVVRGEAAGGRAARARPRPARRRSPPSPLARGRRALLVPSPRPPRRTRGERRR